MPRVAIKKNDYIIKDFRRWLIGELKVQGLRQADMAQWLGISQQAVSAKLKSGKFDMKELLIIFEKLNTDSETVRNIFRR